MDDPDLEAMSYGRRLMAKLAERPLVEITGLVGPSYAASGKSPGEQRPTLIVGLDAWRVDGGWMHTKSLTVRREIGDDESTHWMGQFGIERVIRFRGRVCDDPQREVAEALLEEFVTRDVADAELEAHLKYLQTPIVCHDRLLGEMKWNRRYGWYEGKAVWNGRRAKIRLAMELPESFYAVKSQAHALWDAEETVVGRIQQRVVADLFELKNGTWLEEGQSPLTEKQFLRHLTLDSITIRQDGTWEFWYDDGNLFLGHSIRVSGSLAAGPLEASIEG